MYTKLKKDTITGLFVPDKMGSRKVLLGPFCSNHHIGKSGWVTEMTSCPAVDGKDAKPWKPVVLKGRKRV